MAKVENDWIYFVEVCDYEACWYVSIWDNSEDGRKQFNDYKLNDGNFEQIKRFGKRKINTIRFIGEYLDNE